MAEDAETGGDQMNTEIKMQVKIEGRKGKKRKYSCITNLLLTLTIKMLWNKLNILRDIHLVSG